MSVIIKRAGNGYIIRDKGVGESWVIAGDDPAIAAQEMLVEVNERIGYSRDSHSEHTVSVDVVPGRKWLGSNPGGCTHSRLIEHWSYDGQDVWQCPCGQAFAPVPREG
jgi:hypothetical protein